MTLATLPIDGKNDSLDAVQEQVNSSITDFSNIFKNRDMYADTGTVMYALAPLIMLFSVVMGGFAVVMVLVAMANVIMDLFCVLVSKNAVISNLGFMSKVNDLQVGLKGSRASANSVSVTDYLKANWLEFILTFVVIGLIVSNQLIPVSLQMLTWTSSIVVAITNIDLSVQNKANLTDELESLRKQSEQDRADRDKSTIDE